VWDALGPWFATGGGAGLAGFLAWLVYKLHADAVAAERRRADSAERREADYRTAWQAERDRADMREDQIGVLLGRATKERD
jgi:hypothetical protein